MPVTEDLRSAWIPTLLLAGVYLANEALLLLAGAGEEATFGWAFIYVALRAVALPVTSVGLSLWLIWRMTRASSWRIRTRIAPALVVPPVILALCLLYQMPLFTG